MPPELALRRICATALALGFLACSLAWAGLAAAQGQPQLSPKVDTTLEAAKRDEFRSFVESLWPEAKGRGVSRQTFDEAFRDVTPDAKIIALTKKQSEFVQPIWDYLANAVSPQRIERGREVANEWGAWLEAIEKAYDVPRSVILGVWGMETRFGAFTGNIYAVRALATLAFTKYRGDFFRNELLVALEILEAGHVQPGAMKGSWAGAMGHTQFMPSSFVKYAVDADGDGRRDIWTSVPDALASTANYLRQHGWNPGLPWGFEVMLPEKFDFRHHRHSFAVWARMGVGRADGQAMPRSGKATLFLPAGARGPAFLVTENYDAIKAYNSSDAYALGVAHLGDLIYGAPPIRGAWPSDQPTLHISERIEIQKRLAALGHDVGKTDGKLGSKTREAVRSFQLVRGLVPDGYADPAVLKALRDNR